MGRQREEIKKPLRTRCAGSVSSSVIIRKETPFLRRIRETFFNKKVSRKYYRSINFSSRCDWYAASTTFWAASASSAGASKGAPSSTLWQKLSTSRA